MVLPHSSKRIQFRELQLSDADFMLELLSEPAWKQFIASHNVNTESAARRYIESRILPGYQHGRGLWLIERKQDGIPLGICGLVQRDFLEATDIGFALLERYCGQGFAAEASQQVMEYAKQDLGYEMLWAITVKDNARSIRLLEKLGFRYKQSITRPNDESVELYENKQW